MSITIEELFCHVDDFCKVFLPELNKHLIEEGKKKRYRETRLTMSEMITILILFHQSHYRDLKAFYLNHVCRHLTEEFPRLLSYNRFVTLIPRTLTPLCAYLNSMKKTSDGIAFIDSTPIIVCHNKRIHGHKVFRGIAEIGKSTKGWFYGFKLHLICNHKGELVECTLTQGNVDDRTPVPKMVKGLFGKLFGDKGYISKKLSEKLLEGGLQLITGIRKNMRNKLASLFDKFMLHKRSLIESINNQLKNVFQIEHTRHRSIMNGFVNIVAGLVAFVHHFNKPSLPMTERELKMIAQIC